MSPEAGVWLQSIGCRCKEPLFESDAQWDSRINIGRGWENSGLLMAHSCRQQRGRALNANQVLCSTLKSSKRNAVRAEQEEEEQEEEEEVYN